MEERKLVYANGLPFDGPLDRNLKEQVGRVKGKKASCIVLDGLAGEGKTTLLVEILDYVNSLYDLPLTKLDYYNHPQLAMGGEQFITLFNQSEENKIVILGYDEAGDFNKAGSMTRFNQILFEVFSKFRGFRLIVVLALPAFTVLDNRLFDYLGVVRGIIHCEDRTDTYGNYRSYSLSQANWIRYWHDKLPKGCKIQAYNKCEPNFCGHFLDIAPERSRQLDILSTKTKKASLNEAEIEMQGLLSYYKIANKLGKSVIWTRNKIKELNIKVVRRIKHSAYFDQNAINRLVEYLSERKERRGRPRKNP